MMAKHKNLAETCCLRSVDLGWSLMADLLSLIRAENSSSELRGMQVSCLMSEVSAITIGLVISY